MICSQIKEDDSEFNNLLVATIEKMKKPWENTGLSLDILRASLSTKYHSVNNEISVANQISDILSKNTQGNPRKIKRFLNMLLLRKQMADARGFGSNIQISMLAKLMLAEYYFPTHYKEIATLTDDNGKCPLLCDFEKLLSGTKPFEESDSDAGKDDTKETHHDAIPLQYPSDDKNIHKWRENKDFSKWAGSEPKLGGIDLRPYFFASKEREDFFFNQIRSDQLKELISKLMGNTMSIATAKDDIKQLESEEAKKVFTLLEIKKKKSKRYFNKTRWN